MKKIIHAVLLILFFMVFLDVQLDIKYEIFLYNPYTLDFYSYVFFLFRCLTYISLFFLIFSFFVKKVFTLILMFLGYVALFSLSCFFIYNNSFLSNGEINVVLSILCKYVFLFFISFVLSWFHIKSSQATKKV